MPEPQLSKYDRALRVVILLLCASVGGFFFGSIFNVVSIETFGLNRFLFVFFVPFILITMKKNADFALILSGIAIGLFFSDFPDFISYFANGNIVEITIFSVVFFIYIESLYFYQRLKQ